MRNGNRETIKGTDCHRSSSTIDRLVGAHADEDWMTKVAVVRQLHAGNFDDMADQSPSVGFSPQDFALIVRKARTHGTPGRRDEA